MPRSPLVADASPTAHAVRAQLARILASDLFLRSDRLTAFLTFIVEQTLDGHGPGLKHVLAMEVYGKGADFGAAVDPIVRVDARRLRDKLREYYVAAPHDPVVISVPKGSYAPVFSANGIGVAPELDAAALPSTGLPHAGAAAAEPARWSRLWVAGIAIVLIGAAGWSAINWRRAVSEPPPVRLLTVTSFPGGEGMPSLSPDGNFVVFTWRGVDTIEPADVWVKAVDGDELRQLTATPQFHEAMPPTAIPNGRATGRGSTTPRARPGGRKSGRVLRPAGPRCVSRAAAASSRASRLTAGPSTMSMRRPAMALSRPQTLKQISSAGGAETIVLSGVTPGAWDVIDRGVVFVTGHPGVRATTADPVDALDLYSFADRRVHRLGELPFSVARYGVARLLTVSRDGRWALAAQIDRWERDILVADNVR